MEPVTHRPNVICPERFAPLQTLLSLSHSFSNLCTCSYSVFFFCCYSPSLLLSLSYHSLSLSLNLSLSLPSSCVCLFLLLTLSFHPSLPHLCLIHPFASLLLTF